ncbi:MAG: hypothetical protein KL863_07370 [Rhizobium sp.]|nr:hypothetical protein [Rhizobium sp.]MBX9455845.1 hypothetical protein [Rhizobium sp.]
MLNFLTVLLIAGASSPPDACNIYAARDYPSIKIEEHERTISIVFDAWNKTMDKVVTKPFGALQEGAVEEDGKTVHVFSRGEGRRQGRHHFFVDGLLPGLR